jgi:phosphatidylglycerol:prolipoprotein diacylglycerol transferase
VYPRLFHLGHLSLPTYGFLVASGLIIGLLVTVSLAKRQGIDEDTIWNMGLVAILAGIVGSKLLYILTRLQENPGQPLNVFSLDTLQSGGVFSGGLLLSIAVCYWWAVRHRMPRLKTADSFAPGIAIGHAIGRLGCFAAGCCWGKPTHLPWGVTFTNPLAHELVGTPLDIRLHPTQIYEFLAEAAIFALLIWIFRHRAFPGEVSAVYLFLYGTARYFLEFLRDDPDRGSVFGAMSVTQLIALILVIGGGLMWMLCPRPRKQVQAIASA